MTTTETTSENATETTGETTPGTTSVALEAESSFFYAIRRSDGRAVYQEWAWVETSGPDDWDPVVDDAWDAPAETTYELVRLVVEPVARRTGAAIESAFCGWDPDDETTDRRDQP